MDKPLDWELHFQRRYRCRNSIRPYNCERAFIQRHCGFPGRRPNFGRYTAKISPLSVERLPPTIQSPEKSPHGRIATISMDLSPRRLIRAFFFISPRTANTGLIIGNEETRLITRDKSSLWTGDGNPKFGYVAIYRKLSTFRSIKYFCRYNCIFIWVNEENLK